MGVTIQVIHQAIAGHHYILQYYDTDYGRQCALLALDSWRANGTLNFSADDMDVLDEMIYEEPLAAARFNLPLA